MNKTQIFSPIMLLSLAVGVILLFLLGLTAWLSLPQARIDFGGLTLRQESRPEPVALHSSRVTTQGLAIYRQSEHGLASPRVNVEGMAIYHMSERGTSAGSRINAAGLDIYWQSERSGAVPGSIEEGMAIYLQSERNLVPADPGYTIDEGMEIYHASERDR
jgi:hypothetical protein